MANIPLTWVSVKRHRTKKPLTELGAALFTAHRAATQADDFLKRIDHKGLARRTNSQHETAGVWQGRAMSCLGSRGSSHRLVICSRAARRSPTCGGVAEQA